MAILSKLKADYIELINQQLDNIKVESVEDFTLVQKVLQHILSPQSDYSIPEKYKERMFHINDYLQAPEDYVEHQSDFGEYQEIIKNRIALKIEELQSLSELDKQRYIENQTAGRAQATINQQIMSQREAPAPEHIQSAVDASEGLFTVQDILGQDVFFVRELISPECLGAIREGLFTVQDILGQDVFFVHELISPECLGAIRDGLFTAQDILSAQDVFCVRELISPECLGAIREEITTIEQLKTLDWDELQAANQTGEYPNPPRLGM